jgi:L-ornithine Nalpha-acyltransferase
MLGQNTKNNSRFDVRLAQDENEIRAVQRLRYQVFYEEMGARANPWKRNERRDSDCFDRICDHLIVVDNQAADEYGAPKIVGNYRLTRRSALPADQIFYTESEFDLSSLKSCQGEILELSRSCVHPEYRNRAVLDMLWRGLGAYLDTHKIEIMFGCASFPGIDPETAAEALTFLHQHHLAPEGLRPFAHPGQYVEMQRRCENALDRRQALRQMPPLIRGYIGAGAMVGDGAVVDKSFNTVDVCVMVLPGALSASYASRYRDAV